MNALAALELRPVEPPPVHLTLGWENSTAEAFIALNSPHCCGQQEQGEVQEPPWEGAFPSHRLHRSVNVVEG